MKSWPKLRTGTQSCATAQQLSFSQLIFWMYLPVWSRGRSVSIGTGRPGFDPRKRQWIFLLASASRPAWGQPASCPMGTGVYSSGVKRGRGVMLTTHPHLVPRLRMSRSYTSSPLGASMACSGTALPLPCSLVEEIPWPKLRMPSASPPSSVLHFVTDKHEIQVMRECWQYRPQL
jgi:hypothetical protein